MTISTTTAQSTAGGDAVDRSMRFVERSMAATDLLNTGKPDEALPILQELADRDADLDNDGFAAMSLGDCLAQLNRPDDARRAYLMTAAAHPERKTEVDQRLLDLELAGPITDDLVLRLRAASGVSDESRHIGAWNLGRALQKKAKTLLDEATACFARACEGSSPISRDLCQGEHRTLLNLVSQEFATAIAKAESRWYRGGAGASLSDYDENTRNPMQVLTACRADWTIQTANGKFIRIESRQDKADEKPQLSVDGKLLGLSRDQAALIRLHQEQIARILSEAASMTDSTGRR